MGNAKLCLFLIALLLIAGAVWAMWFLSLHSFSARAKPTPLEAFLGGHIRRSCDLERGKKAQESVGTDAASYRRGAREHFADHGAICGENMYPPAPDMRQRNTQELSDGELFEIVRNGIRFTGMPGWGGEDEGELEASALYHAPSGAFPKQRELMNEINHLEDESQNSGHSQAGDKEKH